MEETLDVIVPDDVEIITPELEELKKINDNLGDLIELISTFNTEETDFRDEVTSYINSEISKSEQAELEKIELERLELEELELQELEELEEPEYLEVLRSIEENTVPIEYIEDLTLDETRNELLTTISENTIQVEREQELNDLEILSQSAILVILSLLVVFGVFYFVRYVYNSITRHF